MEGGRLSQGCRCWSKLLVETAGQTGRNVSTVPAATGRAAGGRLRGGSYGGAGCSGLVGGPQATGIQPNADLMARTAGGAGHTAAQAMAGAYTGADRSVLTARELT